MSLDLVATFNRFLAEFQKMLDEAADADERAAISECMDTCRMRIAGIS